MINKTFDNVNQAVNEAKKARENAKKEVIEYLRAVCEEVHCVYVSPYGYITILDDRLQAIGYFNGLVEAHMMIEDVKLKDLIIIAEEVHKKEIVEEYSNRKQ